jgi:hypothetical protein
MFSRSVIPAIGAGVTAAVEVVVGVQPAMHIHGTMAEHIRSFLMAASVVVLPSRAGLIFRERRSRDYSAESLTIPAIDMPII